jgi:GGDEF domain-containing protein
MIGDLSALNKQELQALVTAMSWNNAMGCHTRAGFEKWIWPQIYPRARHIVYFDVDGVHQLNQQAGTYDVFDAKIRQVLATVRSTDVVAGQWLSGDEFLVCLVETEGRQVTDPHGLVERLTAQLSEHGLTAVFAIAPVTSSLLWENVKPAADQVLAEKKSRGTSSR